MLYIRIKVHATPLSPAPLFSSLHCVGIKLPSQNYSFYSNDQRSTHELQCDLFKLCKHFKIIVLKLLGRWIKHPFSVMAFTADDWPCMRCFCTYKFGAELSSCFGMCTIAIELHQVALVCVLMCLFCPQQCQYNLELGLVLKINMVVSLCVCKWISACGECKVIVVACSIGLHDNDGYMLILIHVLCIWIHVCGAGKLIAECNIEQHDTNGHMFIYWSVICLYIFN
jgi:hypothetical protein